jgi:hypothetical protein
MIKAYDRKGLVARFGPRSFCGSVDDTLTETPTKSWNRPEPDRATGESASKPPTPQWFDGRRDGGLPIKTNDFNRLHDRQATQTTHTTKFEPSDQRRPFDGLPDDWQAILNELKGATPVDGFGDARWTSLVDDAEVFLARWGEAAHLLGWTALDLFGVHPVAPAVRFDVMGLLPLLQGASVVALTKDEARMRRPSGALLTFRRVAQAGAVLVTRCLQ